MSSQGVWRADGAEAALNDPNSQDDEGNLQLHHAAARGDLSRVAGLLDRASAGEAPIAVDAPNWLGETPLFVAAKSGHSQVVDLLLQVQANQEAFATWGPHRGCTPLQVAAKANHHLVVQQLVEAKANVNMEHQTGKLALHFAAEKGSADCVAILLQSKSHVLVHDRIHSSTPLTAAAEGGHAEVARLLLAAGADVNTKNRYGQTPLHLAAIHGWAELGDLLLEAGADGEVTEDYSGWTPLHRAIFHRRHAIAARLVAEGVLIDAKDSDEGKTPLHFAVEARDRRLVDLLLGARADPSVCDNEGNTALGLASGADSTLQRSLSNAVSSGNGGYSMAHGGCAGGMERTRSAPIFLGTGMRL